MKYKILVIGNVDKRGINILNQVAELTFCKPYPSDEELLPLVKEVDAILARSTNISAKVISKAPKLKIISRHGAGVDSVDINAATERNIVVTRVPAANSTTVSEHAFALIFSLLRNIIPAHENLKNGKWERNTLIGSELRGKTIGIIGYGNIGRKVARIADAFEMKILAYDPLIDEHAIDTDKVKKVDFDNLLQESDVVSIHIPLNENTRYLITKKELGLMKSTAILINVSRGGIVNEDDLYDFLKENKIAGAGLDVLAEEPPVKKIKLLELPNVVLTPHIAGQSREVLERVSIEAANNILDVLAGKKSKNVVNKEALYC